MNISKFTTKSQEVVQDCEKVAMDYGHQEMGGGSPSGSNAACGGKSDPEADREDGH